MKIIILSFGIAKDITGNRFLDWETSEKTSVGELRATLSNHFPAFFSLSSLRIAVNSEYAGDDFLLSENDEVALIPPVSGG